MTRLEPPAARNPIGTPVGGSSPNTGPLATATWLATLGIRPEDASWFADIVFDADPQALFEVDETTASRFSLALSDREWGFKFCHDGRLSWIRVSDEPFAYVRDDHALLALVPPLREIGALIRAVERMYGLQLRRNGPLVRTNLPNKPAIREWAFAI